MMFITTYIYETKRSLMTRSFGLSGPQQNPGYGPESKYKPYIVSSGLWALLYFISFCYLANQWSDTSEKDVPESASTGDAYSAILFSFFSIFTWVSRPYGPPSCYFELFPNLAPKSEFWP